MIFILKLTINMELIDTPNPNAKKIETDIQDEEIVNSLNNIEGVSSIFIGPGFLTITKTENGIKNQPRLINKSLKKGK